MSNKSNGKTIRILGLDYGKSKIGLAIADSETRIAFGYGTLKNDKNLLQKIAEIVEKENISKIIIGVPNLETRFPNGNSVSKFAEKLRSTVQIEVEYENEMFTTKMAESNLKGKGVKKIKRFDDQEAARIILQSWLDKNK